jgi:salicylate hydroxylase
MSRTSKFIIFAHKKPSGAKSTIRRSMYPDIELNGSLNVFRATIPGELLRGDPDLKDLLEHGSMWWGPHRIIVSAPLQNGSCYGIELAHPGNTGSAGDWKKAGDPMQMKEIFADFTAPEVGKLINLVSPENLLVWKLVQLPTLDSWVGKSGKLVLVGDAAHAMLPYSGQVC